MSTDTLISLCGYLALFLLGGLLGLVGGVHIGIRGMEKERESAAYVEQKLDMMATNRERRESLHEEPS